MKKEKLAKIDIPAHIFSAMEKLGEAGFEATVVGGCVRDLLMGAEPKDWDVATSARPEEILRIFPDAKYENAFGTVTVPEKYLISLPIISENIKIEAKDKKKLISIANGYLEKIKSDAHRIGHSERVVENALIIAREYGRIAPDVIEIAGYFHDTGRSKYADVRHVEESINIFRKEAEKYLDKKTIQIIAEIIEHRGDIDPVSLEQRIIKEADIIDGINVERYIIAKKIKLTELLEWVKNKFNNEGVYLNIITQKGRELLHEKIKEFNGAELGIQIPENIFSKNSNIEITTYRIESKYSDKRHPDVVRFAKTLKEDLSRRDFTINALAIKVEIASKKNPPHPDPLLIKERELNDGRKFELIDLFSGQEDLKNKLIRAVGDADERFNEDALRMMRAIRFSVTLNFVIEKKTLLAIQKNANNLKFISPERIRDEFSKIILSPIPARGIELLEETGILKIILPEIESGIGVTQSHHHYYGPYNTVYKHLVASLEKCPSKKLEVRLASLFHDVGKPKSKRGEGENATFYNHEYIGERMTKIILERLKFSRRVIDKVTLLVRNHMFYYNVDEVSEAGVRRVVQKIGLENISDLIDVRIADRLGSGVPKAVPYKLRHFQFMVEKVSHDPISVKQLKFNGDDLITELGVEPGPKIGAILAVLLSRVIDDPRLNNKEKLTGLAKELSESKVEDLRKMAEDKIKKEQKKEEELIKKKFRVE